MDVPEVRALTLRDGRRLAYVELGAPRGTPIVHCHGSPSSRVEGNFLFDNAAMIELGVRLILPDRPPLRLMFRLAKYAPPLVGAMFQLNLKMTRNMNERGADRMLASFPEPDRTLLRRPEVLRGFIACFQEACLNGTRGAVHDMGLIARRWGFDPAGISVPVRLWHGERDRNVPVAHGRYLAATIPGCRATFYPDEAHLSVPIAHGREILKALAGGT